MSSDELTNVILAKPEMMSILLDLKISEDFSRRITQAGINLGVKHIRRFTDHDNFAILLDALNAVTPNEVAAHLLLDLYPRDKMPQGVFSFILDHADVLCARDIERRFITKENIPRISTRYEDIWRHVPPELIDEEIAIALFNSNIDSIRRIPNSVINDRFLTQAVKSIKHYERLPEKSKIKLIEMWFHHPESMIFDPGFEHPESASEALDLYKKSDSAVKYSYQRSVERDFIDDFLRCYSMEDLWNGVKSKRDELIVINIHGRSLMEVPGFPPHLKRAWLEEDLSL